MHFSCDSCKANLQIADEKVRGKRLIVRCKRCGAKITISDPALAARIPTPAAVARVSAPPPAAAAPAAATPAPAAPPEARGDTMRPSGGDRVPDKAPTPG